jgi:hypothetical protein
MTNGWSPERRARQAALIHSWQPWRQSTGPRTAGGKAVAAQNGFKGAHWRKLRELSKAMNAVLREHQESLLRAEALTCDVRAAMRSCP